MAFEWETVLGSLPEPAPSAATTQLVMARLRATELGTARVAAERKTQAATVDWRAWSVALGIAAVVAAYGVRLLDGALAHGLLSPRLASWVHGPVGWFDAGYVALLLAVGLALYLPGILWPPHGEQSNTAEGAT